MEITRGSENTGGKFCRHKEHNQNVQNWETTHGFGHLKGVPYYRSIYSEGVSERLNWKYRQGSNHVEPNILY